MIVDLFMVYQFIRRLTTPFKEWEAYKLGIIDEDGTILKKRSKLQTVKERDAFGIFDVMILKLKKLLEKLPGGSSRIGSYAAALWLIREWNHFSDSSTLTEDISDDSIDESTELFYDMYINYTILAESVNQKVQEDGAPTVNVGSGAIAGLGVGPQGEPGLTRSQQKKHKKRAALTAPNQMTKRKSFADFLNDNVKEDLGDSQELVKRKLVYKKHERPVVSAIIPSTKTV